MPKILLGLFNPRTQSPEEITGRVKERLKGINPINQPSINWLKDLALVLGGLVTVMVSDKLGKEAMSLYIASYLVLPAISYHLVDKYGKKDNLDHLRIWKGAAIFVNYFILPFLYWRIWQIKRERQMITKTNNRRSSNSCYTIGPSPTYLLTKQGDIARALQ